MNFTQKLFTRKIDRKIASYQQELIETHYQEVDNMYRQIRGWRHDYRNHIQTMKANALTDISAETAKTALLQRKFCSLKNKRFITLNKQFVPGIVRGCFFLL